MINDHEILFVENNFKEKQFCNLFNEIGYNVHIINEFNEFDFKSEINNKKLIFFNYKEPDKQDPNQQDLDKQFNIIKKIIDYQKNSLKFIITANKISVDSAISLMKIGVSDILMKPIDKDRLQLLLDSFKFEKKENKLRINKSYGSDIITQNKTMLSLINLVKRVASSRASVFINGESGTGKEMFARLIHKNSNRKNGPFIAINCAALPETLLESELFGHEKGSFTGAVNLKKGKFELAHEGTILLDEITEMQLHLQSKLLRVIQEREINRVGGSSTIKLDVRIIATTNQDINLAVTDGKFRQDLFYRLNVIPLKIPPLRQRKDDIKGLVNYFIIKYNKIDNSNVKGLTDEAISTLLKFQYKGNVRELENIIQRAMLLSDGQYISKQDILIDENFSHNEKDCEDESEKFVNETDIRPLKEVEKDMIFNTLDKTDGNRTHAAKMLGISVRTLRNKLKEYKENK